jgi:hypothetical protein
VRVATERKTERKRERERESEETHTNIKRMGNRSTIHWLSYHDV